MAVVQYQDGTDDHQENFFLARPDSRQNGYIQTSQAIDGTTIPAFFWWTSESMYSGV